MPFKKGTKIDRDFILTHVSEEDIFEKYFLPVVYDQSVRNKFRNDDSAGCKFYINKMNGRIRFKDFGQGHNWDCFDVAQKEIRLPFKQTLLRIAEDFGLIESKGDRGVSGNLPIIPNGTEARKVFANKVKEKFIKIYGGRLSYKWKEREFWKKFGIRDKDLQKFYVYGFDKATLFTKYMDGSLKTTPLLSSRSELKFAYYLGKGEWKLYYPDRPKGGARFIQIKGDTIQGYYLLPDKGENLVWTKGYKDVIAFDSLISMPSIATQSENLVIPNDVMIEMLGRFENHYILYDNDISGMRGAMKNIIEYPHLKSMLYPKTRPKDLTDNVEKFGRKQIIQELTDFL